MMQYLGNGVWLVKLDGTEVELNTPIYLGACIVEMAKLHMYQLLYDKLMKIFPTDPREPKDPGCSLIYTDTDSFILRVRLPEGVHTNEELYAYIAEKDPNLIGSLGGQVKPETGMHDSIAEIFAFRAKLYSYVTEKMKRDVRAKGTTRATQLNVLDFEAFRTVFETTKGLVTHDHRFNRSLFNVSSQSIPFQAINPNDGKRYICKDGIHTHAFGYPEYEEDEEEEMPSDDSSDLIFTDEEVMRILNGEIDDSMIDKISK